MPRFFVVIPIAGHVMYEIEAESEGDAIDIAMDKDPNDGGDVTYETLRTFITGYVCRCPSPWEATAEKVTEYID